MVQLRAIRSILPICILVINRFSTKLPPIQTMCRINAVARITWTLKHADFQRISESNILTKFIIRIENCIDKCLSFLASKSLY